MENHSIMCKRKNSTLGMRALLLLTLPAADEMEPHPSLAAHHFLQIDTALLAKIPANI